MPTAEIQKRVDMPQTPLGGMPVPTIDAKPPAVQVAKKGFSLPSLPSFSAIRRGYEALDFDGLREDHGGNRTWATANNAIGALLAAGCYLPETSLIAAGITIAVGGTKFIGALIAAGEYRRSDIGKGLMVGALKDAVKGGSVFLLPGVAVALNGLSAIKDTVDTFSASSGKPRA